MEKEHTINSGIVKDALYCLAKNPLPQSYIGGGISLHFTLSPELHRKTSDIDLTTSQYTSPEQFRKVMNLTFEELIQRGYSLDFKKSRNTLDAHLDRDDYHLMVQIPRRSEKNFERKKKILEREVAHAQKISYEPGHLYLISLEDLTAHKSIRGTIFTENYKLKKPEFIDSLTELKFAQEQLKKALTESLYTLAPSEVTKKVAEIRLYGDIFDIKAVLTHSPQKFDQKYFLEALESFDTFSGRGESNKWKKFFDLVASSI